MKKIFLMICVCVMVFSNLQIVSAHYDTAYWHETYNTVNNSRWMENIDGKTRISELSIPGTHDSMAYRSDLAFIDNTRTQTMNLQQQLESGIRYLDIRVKDNGNNNFVLHHGIVYLGFSFDYVLQELQKFLNQNPSETVFMRIKQEQSSTSDNEMRKIFNKYYYQYKNLFWQKSGNNPTLNEVRGKVVLLSDIYSLNDYGINYRDIFVQDDYNLNTNWDLYSKWEKIKKFAFDANNRKSSLNINHLSGSGGSMPYFVASGHSSPQTNASRLATGLTEPAFKSHYPDFPRTGRLGQLATISFEGTNTLFANLIENGSISYTGIVAADFPGERLIQNIINLNNKIETNGKLSDGVYYIGLANSNNAVLDRNSVIPQDGFTFWTYNGGPNQKWIVTYDKDRDAYQIKSYEDQSKILAWNDYAFLQQVFVTPNQNKPEHYWKIEPYGNGYVIRNYKNNSFYLSKNGNSNNGARATLKTLQNYDDVVFTFNK